MFSKIVSGGQTGVDRAALDVALELGIPCGGWCPQGRRAEDGRIDERFPLCETPWDGYPQQTEWNVRDSDGTLVLARGQPDRGTALTVRGAHSPDSPITPSTALPPSRGACYMPDWPGHQVPGRGFRPAGGRRPPVTHARLALALLLVPSLAHPGDFERAEEAMKGKQYEKAIAGWTAYLLKHPGSAAGYHNRGVAHAARGAYDKAIRDYDEAIRLVSTNAIMFDSRGVAYAGQKEFGKAVADFTVAVRLDPEDGDAYYNRGTAYLRQKEYDTGVADLTQAIRLGPGNADAHLNRGCGYFGKKQYRKAIADLSEAIRLDAGTVEAFYNRGICFTLVKQYRKAIRDFAAVLRLNPERADASNNLAWLRATVPADSLRDGKAAVKYGKKACALTKWQNAHCLGTLAAAYAECGDFKAAVRWQTKALEVGYGDKEETEKARQRLRLYEQGKPNRDE